MPAAPRRLISSIWARLTSTPGCTKPADFAGFPVVFATTTTLVSLYAGLLVSSPGFLAQIANVGIATAIKTQVQTDCFISTPPPRYCETPPAFRAPAVESAPSGPRPTARRSGSPDRARDCHTASCH